MIQAQVNLLDYCVVWCISCVIFLNRPRAVKKNNTIASNGINNIGSKVRKKTGIVAVCNFPQNAVKVIKKTSLS